MEEQIKGAEPLENERHEKFCQELLASPQFSITEAGKAAGYKHRQNSWDVYKIPKVQERIKYLKSMLMAELGVDQLYVVRNLRNIAERCMQAQPVLDRAGDPVLILGDEGELKAAYKFDSAGAIRATELLGKHTGMFGDKVQHEHTGSVDMNLKVVFEDDGEASTK
ncbi:terminase small subunit [Acinetobacter nosocomialis]|uniref:terminase small subunit n=1 Tax=Acinetobacter nosocomialis TaxID=106654 RepID=UPI002F40C982